MRQEEALKFNFFFASHCLLYNTAFICFIVHEAACYEKKDKRYLSAQKNSKEHSSYQKQQDMGSASVPHVGGRQKVVQSH